MATKTPHDQRKQQIGDLISCGICLDYFVDPRILPCSHTYCLQCIHQTASSNGGLFQCPMRDGTEIEGYRIDSLPINRVVRDMVEVLPTMVDTNRGTHQGMAQPVYCDCSLTVAEIWCIDCKAGFCTQCSNDVHGRRALRQHQRVPIHEKPAEFKRCDKHPDEKLKYWCSCETVICGDCDKSKQHRDHTCVPIDDVVPDVIEKLNDKFQEAQATLSQKQGQGSESANDDANIRMITQTFDVLRTAINKYEETLKNQVRTIKQSNKKLTEDYLALLHTKQAELSKHNTDFGTILATKDGAQLLGAQTRLTADLEGLTNELKALKPPVRTEYRIEGVDQLPSSLNDILKTARVLEQKSGNCCDHNQLLGK